MYALVLSALRSFGMFIFRSAVVKWAIYFGLFFIVEALSGVIGKLLPDAGPLGAALASIPCDVWYWLDLFAFSAGLPAVISAVLTRFIIRRLPIVG